MAAKTVKRKVGGQPHEPTIQTRKDVTDWARAGWPRATIAKQLGITRPTLNKYYSEELLNAAIRAEAEVVSCLFVNATDNMDVRAQQNYLNLVSRSGEVHIRLEKLRHKNRMEYLEKQKELGMQSEGEEWVEPEITFVEVSRDD